MNQLQKQADEINIPDNLDALIKSSMKSYTRQKIGKRIFAGFLSVVMLYAALIGACCASSTAADTLSNLPVVGYLFRNFTDKDLKKASETGLTQIVNQSVTKGDTTVTVNELYYDVNSVNLGVSFQNSQANYYYYEIRYENKLVTKFGSGGGGAVYQDEKGRPTSEEVHLPLTQVLPDSCTVKLIVEEGDGSHRKFEFEIPLNNAKANELSKEYPLNQKFTDGMSTLVVKSIVFTPYATTVTYDFTYPYSIVDENSIASQLLDSNGKSLTFKSASISHSLSGNNRTESVTIVYESLIDDPDKVTFNISLAYKGNSANSKTIVGGELQLGE